MIMVWALEYTYKLMNLGLSSFQYPVAILTINPQTPLSTNAGSYLCVKEHKRSIAPDSKIGSLDGENSNRRLQRVDEATTMKSQLLAGEPNIFISGFQTG